MALKQTEQLILDRLKIVLSDLSVGAVIPSERALASALGVSRPTIKRALLKLASEGVVELKQGCRPRLTKSPHTLSALTQMLEVEPELEGDLKSFMAILGDTKPETYPESARRALERLRLLVGAPG